MNRKQFLLLAATSLAATSCESLAPGIAAGGQRVIDAGPAGSYAREGFYDSFRNLGFYLVRRQGKLTALSSYCTHRHCQLSSEEDHSFTCPCHGSTFDPSGRVTEGPATRDLPQFPVFIDTRGHVLVTVS